MSIYESAFLEQGYDDIDFVVDITEEELKEMGITQQGEQCSPHCYSDKDVLKPGPASASIL